MSHVTLCSRSSPVSYSALAFAVDGGVITESIFSWPGMGQTLVSAALTEDLASGGRRLSSSSESSFSSPTSSPTFPVRVSSTRGSATDGSTTLNRTYRALFGERVLRLATRSLQTRTGRLFIRTRIGLIGLAIIALVCAAGRGSPGPDEHRLGTADLRSGHRLRVRRDQATRPAQPEAPHWAPIH